MISTWMSLALAEEGGLDDACLERARGLGMTASESSGSGSGRWAVWDRTFSLSGPGRTVSLIERGGGGSVRSEVTLQGSPTAAEREVLLACAHHAETSSRDALAHTPVLSVSGVEPDYREGVWLVAGTPIPWSSTAVTPSPPRRSWTRDDQIVPPEEESCPCWSVFNGPAFAPMAQRQESLAAQGWPRTEPAGWMVWATAARNPTYALGLGGRTVRWVGLHYGPAKVLGSRGSTSWIAGYAPLDDTGFELYAVDPARSTLGAIAVHGATLHKLDSAALDPQKGIPADSDAGERIWLPWSAIERALAKPGEPVEILASAAAP